MIHVEAAGILLFREMYMESLGLGETLRSSPRQDIIYSVLLQAHLIPDCEGSLPKSQHELIRNMAVSAIEGSSRLEYFQSDFVSGREFHSLFAPFSVSGRESFAVWSLYSLQRL